MFIGCKTSDSSSNIQIMFGSSRRSWTPFAYFLLRDSNIVITQAQESPFIGHQC